LHQAAASADVTASQKAASRRGGLPVPCRDHPLGKIVDLLEALAPGHRQLAGAPEIFQRRLRRVPVPPSAGVFATTLLRFVPAQVPRHDRALGADVVEHPVQHRLETLAVPLAPTFPQGLALPGEAAHPVGIEAGRDDRGVVGPVLEQRRLALQQVVELAVAVGVIARKEDQVVGALHRVDAVDLDEAQLLDQIVEALAGEAASHRPGKALSR
jgi:hypothetical protein